MLLGAMSLMACNNEDESSSTLPNDDKGDVTTTPSDNNGTDASDPLRTLIVYYSYTNNTKQIVDDLKSLVSADVVQVTPAEKGLDYSANNYKIGTDQLTKIKNAPNSLESYPEIDPLEVDFSKYDTVIVATPLWWSQMASNMQTFLFKNREAMSGKTVGLIVSSHSSGIRGVESDLKRLVPDGKFLKSLWINASNHSNRKSLLKDWVSSEFSKKN